MRTVVPEPESRKKRRDFRRLAKAFTRSAEAAATPRPAILCAGSLRSGVHRKAPPLQRSTSLSWTHAPSRNALVCLIRSRAATGPPFFRMSS